MSDLWPRVESDADLDALRERGECLLPGVAALAQRLGWGVTSLHRFEDGSLPVFALAGDRVLKLYPARYRDDFRVESRVLQHLSGRVACPAIVASGELEGWSYLVMTRLAGRPLALVWDAIAGRQRMALADAIGRWLAVLHAVPVAGLDLPALPWPAFIEGQLSAATSRQRALGLGEPWLEQLEPFVREVGVVPDGPTVLLHTEMMREHIFVAERHGSWELTGVLDFEPAMRGAREYEFASVGIFTSCGDAAFLRRILQAYGYDEAHLDHSLQRRFLAYAILHRFAHLGWYLRRMPPRDGARTLDDLARQWWTLG